MHPEAQDTRISDVLSKVQIPLSNVEFTIEQYLLEHGSRLDLKTRVLLASVRDCVGIVADSTRDLSHVRKDTPQRVGRAA